MDNWSLVSEPAGAVEILFATSTTAPQPSALFSQQQELTAKQAKIKQINEYLI